MIKAEPRAFPPLFNFAPNARANRKQMKTAPGPKGHFIFGSIREVKNDRIQFVSSLAEKYGDVVRFKMGPKTLYLINHPDLARYVLIANHKNYHKGLGLTHAKPLLGQGLLTSEDDLWHSQRKLIQNLFHNELIEGYVATMNAEIDDMLDDWQNRKTGIDVFSEMTGLSLRILSKTLFNIDIEDRTNQISKIFSIAIKEASYRMTNMLDISSYIPSPHSFRLRRALKSLDALIFDLIEKRKRDESFQGKDFLSILLKSGNQPSNKQIRDEIITMLLAGHETTSVALSWSIFLLAKYPEYQVRLRGEFNQLRGTDDEAINLSRLKYPLMILNESMRLYPPVWLIPRRAIMPDEIGGYNIESGAEVLICLYNIHRHEQFWQKPDHFEPERFDPEDKNKNKYGFLPFGLGPRVCIGKHFASLEAQISLTKIISRFVVRLQDQKAEIKLDPLLTLRPKEKIIIDLRQLN